MNNRADFYILKENNYLACLPFTCQLIGKAYAQYSHMLINTESTLLNKSLDEKLWTYQSTSFIPHAALPEQNQIIVTPIDQAQPTLLLNLTLPTEPTEIKQQRLLQLVLNTNEHLQCARQYYKYYQQLGVELKTHKL